MIRKEVLFVFCMLLASPAVAQKKDAPADQPLPTYRVEADGFKSDERDIKAVCDSAATEIWRHLEPYELEPFVVKRGYSGPFFSHGKNSRGELEILLDVEGAYWSQYAYQPDQPQNYGEDFTWEIDGEQAVFESDRWYSVTHEIRMNTPGENDGSIRTWIDGVLALSVEDMRFRDIDDFAIDNLYFSTFFGGSDSSWATTKDEITYFDDFIIEVIEPVDTP